MTWEDERPQSVRDAEAERRNYGHCPGCGAWVALEDRTHCLSCIEGGGTGKLPLGVVVVVEPDGWITQQTYPCGTVVRVVAEAELSLPTKHTPGPWAQRTELNQCVTITASNGDYEVCDVLLEQPDGGEDQAMARVLRAQGFADANLISAAPDLLACCQRALVHSARVHPDFLAELRAAIAKATGESAHV